MTNQTESSALDKRPHQDGAPWWDVDVSKIPDAVPTQYNGTLKASPYTVLGKTYYPLASAATYKETGLASWYGTKFHDQATANGEKYDLYGMTAAHKTLPLPCYVRVTNLENGKNVVVRVNDRGPFHSDRIIDLSFAAAKKLGYADKGTARVRVEGIDVEHWTKEASVIGTSVPSVKAVDSVGIDNSVSVAGYTQASVDNEIPGIYLQVGAFSNANAAELLKAQLSENMTTKVNISSTLVGESALYRVRLGPLQSKSEAQKLLDNKSLSHVGPVAIVTVK
ncbi:UNVERIFIED_CONTAM: hypothetical protein GTU68_034678 [Idotea baltica]|nr:hypothetical protein [Idotea baltica]